MRLVKQLLESLTLALAAAVAVFVFHRFGGFTLSASLLLGSCFAYVGMWIHGLHKVAAFKPYSVQIFVNFETLREDFGMVKDSEQTDSEEIARELYNFTAINSALFAHYSEYVYNTAQEMNLTGRSTRTDDDYRSAIQFGDTIPGILKFTTDFGDPRTRIGWFPRFMFRPSWKGFQLSVQVVPEWWSVYKRFLTPEMQSLSVDYDGFIVLAHLPYGYIPEHVQRAYAPMGFFYPFNTMHRRWKSKLSKHGWTVGDEYDEISSRYLIVRYQNIWPTS